VATQPTFFESGPPAHQNSQCKHCGGTLSQHDGEFMRCRLPIPDETQRASEIRGMVQLVNRLNAFIWLLCERLAHSCGRTAGEWFAEYQEESFRRHPLWSREIDADGQRVIDQSRGANAASAAEGWIACTDRMPPICPCVLVWVADAGDPTDGWFEIAYWPGPEYGWYTDYGVKRTEPDPITHWMPLPKSHPSTTAQAVKQAIASPAPQAPPPEGQDADAAIRQVLKLARRHQCYGAFIYALSAEWSMLLQKDYGLSKKSADMEAFVPGAGWPDPTDAQAQARTRSAPGAASAPEGKDCPHCGHEPAIENLRSSTPVYPIAMRIRCSDCGASAAVAMGTDHDAVLLKAWSMWDRRFTSTEAST
jgi:hypothetical protein